MDAGALRNVLVNTGTGSRSVLLRGRFLIAAEELHWGQGCRILGKGKGCPDTRLCRIFETCREGYRGLGNKRALRKSSAGRSRGLGATGFSALWPVKAGWRLAEVGRSGKSAM